MFFKTQDSIPEGLGFSTFDKTHLLWLLSGAVLIFLASILYRNLNPERQKKMLKILGIYIFCQEMLKNIVVSIVGEFEVGYLPLHLCGINILLILFDVIKPTATVRSFLYYFCIPGAALALLFPNWTETPFFNFFHFHSFLIHISLVMYPVLLISAGQVKLNLKAVLKSLALLILLAIPIYFLNILWETNFMFLREPDSGNPLELFEKLLGNHLWGFLILLPVVLGLMQLPVTMINKIKGKKVQNN